MPNLRSLLVSMLLVTSTHVSVHADMGSAEGEVNKKPPTDAQSAEATGSAQPGLQSGVQAGGAPVAAASTNTTGNDANTVAAVNGSSAALMASGSEADELLAKKKITEKDWLKLKAAMAGTFTGAVQAAQRSAGPAANYAQGRKATPSNDSSPAPVSMPAPPAEAVLIQSGSPSVSAPVTRSLASVDPGEPVELAALEATVAAPSVVLATAPTASAEAAYVPEVSDGKSLQFNDAAKRREKESSSNPIENLSALLVTAPVPAADKHEEAGEGSEARMAVLKVQNAVWKKESKKALANAKAISDEDGAPGAVSDAAKTGQKAIDGLKRSIATSGYSDKPGKIGLANPQDSGSAVELSDHSILGRNGSVEGGSMDGMPASDNSSQAIILLLLGAIVGLCFLALRLRRARKTMVQVMIPSQGEHFSIRESAKGNQFILDVKDVRGRLVRTAGILRPTSVTRAAVLPPEMAVRLGADGSFDRFEYTHEGKFVRTEKEEGYQVFPFVDDEDKQPVLDADKKRAI